MQTIEDIVYEAIKIGVKNRLFEKVEELTFREEYRHQTLNTIYDIAFKEILKETKEK